MLQINCFFILIFYVQLPLDCSLLREISEAVINMVKYQYIHVYVICMQEENIHGLRNIYVESCCKWYALSINNIWYQQCKFLLQTTIFVEISMLHVCMFEINGKKFQYMYIFWKGNTVYYFLLTNYTKKNIRILVSTNFLITSAHFEHIEFISFLPKLLIVLVKFSNN